MCRNSFEIFAAGFLASRGSGSPYAIYFATRAAWKASGVRAGLAEEIGEEGANFIDRKVEQEFVQELCREALRFAGELNYHMQFAKEKEKILDPDKVEEWILSVRSDLDPDVDGWLVRHPIDGIERERRARLPQVALLTRYNRVKAAIATGNPHRGMIPGGEDEAAYLAAVQTEFDPDPVWVC